MPIDIFETIVAVALIDLVVAVAGVEVEVESCPRKYASRLSILKASFHVQKVSRESNSDQHDFQCKSLGFVSCNLAVLVTTGSYSKHCPNYSKKFYFHLVLMFCTKLIVNVLHESMTDIKLRSLHETLHHSTPLKGNLF